MDIEELEKILVENINNTTLPDEVFNYMACMINEEPSKNGIELYNLIGDFVTDGMAYSREEARELCEVLVKTLHQAGLNVENKDTIIAQKLANPIQIQDEVRKTGLMQKYTDPLLGLDKSEANYNMTPLYEEKKKVISPEEEKKTNDALDQKIAMFVEHKARIPPPQVIHDKDDVKKVDVIINNFTMLVGGKALLENAKLKLTMGRKYGLIGRNGIGKTTLLNSICAKEINNFP